MEAISVATIILLIFGKYLVSRELVIDSQPYSSGRSSYTPGGEGVVFRE